MGVSVGIRVMLARHQRRANAGTCRPLAFVLCVGGVWHLGLIHLGGHQVKGGSAPGPLG
jgi:hypothetical protein